MNKKLLNSLIITLILLSFSTNSYSLLATGKITIKVISEDGSPVDGARVGIGFDDVRSKSKENSVIGFTDDQGLFSGSETTTSGYMAFNITKHGYYKTTGDYQFIDRKTFGWEPWNPELKVVLRKIENPVPMYARQAKIELPVSENDVGFDLVEYDWVIPYGKGKYSDFIFNLNRNFTAWNDQHCILIIKLNNSYNGIQLHEDDRRVGSEFKLNRYAPSSNYKNEQKLFINASNGVWNSNVKNTDNYYFRIRSQEKDGKLYKAMYGKISGHLDFSPINSKTAIIVFNYYLNPDYTRNLEFDTKRNLFGNLPDLEQVREP